MKNVFKRILPLTLSLIMLLSCTGCMAAYLVSEAVDPGAKLFGGAKRPVQSSAEVMNSVVLNEPETSAFTGGKPLSELVYERPDTEEIYAAIDALNALIDAGETDAERLLSDYEHILCLFDGIDTAACVAYFFHAADVTDTVYEKEYNDLVAVEYDVDVPLTKLTVRLYESPVTQELMNGRYSERYKEVCYLGLELNNEAIQPWKRRETELVTRYDELLSTFTIEDGGRRLSIEDINAVGDIDETRRLADLYYSELNKAAGAIFDELIEVRTSISTELGHATYTDYAYKSLLRTYTPEDVKPLYKAVKKYIVPLYSDHMLKFYMNGGSEIADSFSVDRELFVKQLRCVLSDKYPDVLSALDQMLTLGNWYCEPGANRMQSEFTLTFPAYGSQCICSFWDGAPSGATTLTHELGHYTRGYLTAGLHNWSSTSQLDLDEMDSQGLQYLMIPHYEAFFGDAADAVVKDSLLDAIYAIIVGCMEDEFQQAVYENPSMTNEERNKIYAKVTKEYGFKKLYGYTGTEWITIPHTFQSPLYYISYSVSVIPVLELLTLYENDPEKAVGIYNELIHRAPDADFRETVMALGLSDPLSPDTVKAVSKSLKKLLK